MVGIRGFEFSKVQGGTYPAMIWKNYMDAAHFGLPKIEFDQPAPPERANARLVLPGNECEVTVVGTTGGEPIVPEEPGAPPVAVEQFQAEPPPPPAPEEPAPVETTPIVVITAKSDLGTTIAPDNLDPNHPLPSVAIGRNISPC
jgi:penicillin-binding protein 1A